MIALADVDPGYGNNFNTYNINSRGEGFFQLGYDRFCDMQNPPPAPTTLIRIYCHYGVPLMSPELAEDQINHWFPISDLYANYTVEIMNQDQSIQHRWKGCKVVHHWGPANPPSGWTPTPGMNPRWAFDCDNDRITSLRFETYSNQYIGFAQ